MILEMFPYYFLYNKEKVSRREISFYISHETGAFINGYQKVDTNKEYYTRYIKSLGNIHVISF